MKIKKLLGLIAICALAVISLGSFFGLARSTINDIAGFDFKTVNEANYFKVDSYYISNIQGAPYKVSDDGEITFNLSESDVNMTGDTLVKIQTVTLEEGNYVFKSGVRNTSKDTYCLMLKEVGATGEDVDDPDIVYADTSFKVTESTNYIAYICIAEAQPCEDVTFTPILVEKGEKAKFYIYDFNPFNNED